MADDEVEVRIAAYIQPLTVLSTCFMCAKRLGIIMDLEQEVARLQAGVALMLTAAKRVNMGLHINASLNDAVVLSDEGAWAELQEAIRRYEETP